MPTMTLHILKSLPSQAFKLRIDEELKKLFRVYKNCKNLAKIRRILVNDPPGQVSLLIEHIEGCDLQSLIEVCGGLDIDKVRLVSAGLIRVVQKRQV